ncbi:MAG: hypothetical protein PWQ31_513 [Eubacteriales bacterium]|nr:hypothetical protein [Eubacteriales bacterium]
MVTAEMERSGYGETVFSREFTPYLPDRTAPPAVGSVSISGSNGPAGSGSSATVTATWTGVNDPTTGSNSGTNLYRVYLYKTDLKTGSHPPST